MPMRKLRKRERDQANAGRANFLNDTKFKKLVAKYRKALERVEELAKEGQKFTVTLPITFTLDTETYEEHGYVRPFGRLADVYSNSVTNAKIAKVPELSKAQLELLQDGLERVVENACEEILGLFPSVIKEQEAAFKELNKVLAEFDKLRETHNYQLLYEDLEEVEDEERTQAD